MVAYHPDFSGVHAKIDRGWQHALALNNETGFVDDVQGNPVQSPFNRIPLRIEYDPETGYHLLRATAHHSEKTVRRWGLITGDAVHNFRSALDHLVWQLACHKIGGASLPGVSEREARTVQFPLDDEPPENGDPPGFRNKNTLKHVLPEHRAIIYEHQSFGNRFDHSHGCVHPFTQLRKLSNDDKHRLITPIAMLPNSFGDMKVSPFGGVAGEIVESEDIAGPDWMTEPDAVIMRVKIQPENVRLNTGYAGYLAPTPSFQYELSDGTTYVCSVYIQLIQVALQIRMVVDEFENLFKPGPTPPPVLRPSAR